MDLFVWLDRSPLAVPLDSCCGCRPARPGRPVPSSRWSSSLKKKAPRIGLRGEPSGIPCSDSQNSPPRDVSSQPSHRHSMSIPIAATEEKNASPLIKTYTSNGFSTCGNSSLTDLATWSPRITSSLKATSVPSAPCRLRYSTAAKYRSGQSAKAPPGEVDREESCPTFSCGFLRFASTAHGRRAVPPRSWFSRSGATNRVI